MSAVQPRLRMCAGPNGFAVQQNRAAPAGTLRAAVLYRGKARLFAKILQQIGVFRHFMSFSIDLERVHDYLFTMFSVCSGILSAYFSTYTVGTAAYSAAHITSSSFQVSSLGAWA